MEKMEFLRESPALWGTVAFVICCLIASWILRKGEIHAKSRPQARTSQPGQ
jgi:hypothetical protein